MTAFNISLNLRQIEDALQQLGPLTYPILKQAVSVTAHQVQAEWQESVYRALPGSNAWAQGRRDEAMASIKVSFDGGPFMATVSSDHEAVVGVEDGEPARDLKRMLQTSSKTKVSHNGKRYLTIPFRHNTPGNSAHAGAMPADVYAQAKQLQPSTVTGRQLRVNAHGLPTIQNRYLWGGALPAGLVPKLKPSHKTDPMAGMVRMTTGPKSSAYLTFRVMHQDSTGWIIPAKPGQNIAKGIAERGGAMLTDSIRALLAQLGV